MADLYLDVNGASKHIDAPVKRNENNPGLGVRYNFDSQDGIQKFLTAGQYLNSHNKNTIYAGGGFLKRVSGDDSFDVKAGAMAGGMTGYKNPITPAILPMLSAGTKNSRLNLLFAPKTSDSAATVMLNASIRLGGSSEAERAARIKENMLKKDE